MVVTYYQYFGRGAEGNAVFIAIFSVCEVWVRERLMGEGVSMKGGEKVDI